MKKWPIIVAGLYGLTLLVMFGPLVWIAFLPSPPEISKWLSWQLLVIVAVMALVQWALLRVPVQVASRRPVTRRSLWSTVIAAAFMMGLLAFGGVACIYELITKLKGDDHTWVILAAGLASWVFWAFYFYRSAKQDDSPEQSVRHTQRFLWSGSILELLIAIPTHIVARHRDYCCAGAMTFIGLTCGFSVVIFAFGPALYFLFIERWKRTHPNQQG